MQHYHTLDEIGITLTNFKKIFASIETKLINDCHDLKLLHTKKSKYLINLTDKDVKKLLMHHTIYEVCEEVISSKDKKKNVILFRPFEPSDTFEILTYVSLSELNKQLVSIIESIKKTLPIQIVIFKKEVSFHRLKEKLEKKDGDTTELIYKILSNMTAINISFEKVKKFANKNGLRFLSREYFDKIRTKQLFF